MHQQNCSSFIEPDSYLTKEVVADRFGVSAATIDRWAKRGGFLTKVKLSPYGRRVGFLKSEVDACLSSCREDAPT